MNYVEQLAADIRRQVQPEQLPRDDAETLFLFYAVLALAKGAAVTNSDVHDAWVAWKTSRGEGAHESATPFGELSTSVQAEDAPFAEAIRRVAPRRPPG
jgi:hypothetical protein